ncbi:MAG: hypothetical protein M0D55_10920 [Elusimicrobiota bacterium]|nr:MAG: hypothetical protein M0D55_10920 [Elusimicrobiota bacterium]
MVQSIETEQDANFAERVIYHEMIQAGEARLPLTHPIDANYDRWAKQAKALKLGAFYEDLQTQYGDAKVGRMNVAVSSVPRVLRPPLRGLLIGVDADFLRTFETLDYQKTKWWNLTERETIESTRYQHGKESLWQIKWMTEHQTEF